MSPLHMSKPSQSGLSSFSSTPSCLRAPSNDLVPDPVPCMCIIFINIITISILFTRTLGIRTLTAAIFSQSCSGLSKGRTNQLVHLPTIIAFTIFGTQQAQDKNILQMLSCRYQVHYFIRKSFAKEGERKRERERERSNLFNVAHCDELEKVPINTVIKQVRRGREDWKPREKVSE